ncbi:3D domain-containing protein [Bacillus arachidis]|uniref:Cell surface protein n=1 Tax=Bacillus arachidis TaxID=2819290 RepID=A0ABS3NUN0_9BACI|nr:3D domain-containing protein [Bacillus arachidis]MBO1624575.1 cell surface protein [Bacillus arachidis]
MENEVLQNTVLEANLVSADTSMSTLNSRSHNVTSQQAGWVQLENGKWIYNLENNQGTVKNDWKKIGQRWFQFDENGYLVEKNGWGKWNERYIYYVGVFGIATSEWQKIDGKWYQFDENGYLVEKTGWDKLDGKWIYYVGDQGIVTNEWKSIDGGWYQFDENGYLVEKTGWDKSNDKWIYYQGEKGIVVGGWKKIDGRWFEFDYSGYLIQKEGWEKRGDKWVYYVPGNYGLATNETMVIDQEKYSFDENGYWIDNVVEYTAEATAYSVENSPPHERITAYGIDIGKNPNIKLIAVDPKVIRLGTKVFVEGYGEAIAGDTGGDIKGKRIDVLFPTEREAIRWGRKTVKIRVFG